MAERILIIHHMSDRRADRVSAGLRQRGFSLDWCCPAHGDALPGAGKQYAATVVFGGAQSVNDTDKPYLGDELRWIERWVDAGHPYFGICLGAQLLARSAGARVLRDPDGRHEIGYVPVHPAPAAADFMPTTLHAYQWHNEGFELPHGAELLATGDLFANQAYRIGTHAYGVQFHPEVTPAIFQSWFQVVGHMLEYPGAHPAARQLADAKRYDALLAAWLNRFLDHWLGKF